MNHPSSAAVPVELSGELSVKEAVPMVLHNQVEVEALPLDLPEKFIIDLTQFTEVGQMVTFAQLPIEADKVVLKVAEEQMNEPVVMIQAFKEEPVEEVAPVVPVEGEAPAEGEKAPTPEGMTTPESGEKKASSEKAEPQTKG